MRSKNYIYNMTNTVIACGQYSISGYILNPSPHCVV